MSKSNSIKLRKYTWWWLLLLLPLLLLMPFKKNIYIQTVESESGAVISGADVYFHYRKQSVRTSGSPVMKYTRKTDKNGIVEFYALRYRLYSWIFKHKSETLIYATSNCYMSDTLQPNFHSIRSNDTIQLKLATKFAPLNFKVVDDDDNEPLPDATVRIIVERDGKVYVDSAISGADGIVNFEKIPVCGIVKSVIGIADGYFPDSIINKNVDELIGNIDSLRQLRLKPIKKQIVFYVIDCVTKQPIPNATVTIDFNYKNKRTRKTKRTNVNGVGKGTYDDAHIIAEITLRAEKKYYKLGQLPEKYKVRDFLKLPKEKRTICLEPNMIELTFRTIKQSSKQLLPDVKLTITVDGKVISTLNNSGTGIFKIRVSASSIISIVASKKCYKINSTKIRNKQAATLMVATQANRDIPMKSEVKAQLQKCWNPGRPHYDLYIDGKYIMRFISTTGSIETPGVEGPHYQRIDIDEPLTSGVHTFKFVLAEEHGKSVCYSCTKLIIDCIGKEWHIEDKKNNEFTVKIP